MYTQCPECLTIYQIDEDALQSSLGIVRCGRCDKRFDALRTLSNTLPVDPLVPLPELDLSEHAPILTEAVPLSAFERAAKKARSKKSPTSLSTTPTQAALGADDGLSSSESELASPSVAAPSGVAASDTWQGDASPFELSEVASIEVASDATTQIEVEDDLDEVLTAETDAAFSALALASTSDAEPMEAAPDAFDPDAVLSLDLAEIYDDAQSADEGMAAPQWFATIENETDALDMDVSDGVAWSEIAQADHEPGHGRPAEPVYVRPHRHDRRFSRTGAMWALGCCLLALVLVAQLAWATRAEWFENPATHAWMARVCASVACHLPLIKDTAKLQLLSRDVRPDPHVAGTLTLTATIRNNAIFSQPWPVVVVELTDLNNDPVAMRRFRPAEYLPDAARRAAGIAPEATAAVAFEVADPGKQAVAFQFGFE